MKTKIYNESNIDISKVNSSVTRVKALIINDDKILIDNVNGGIQLPGGHVEDGEDLIEAVKREVEEETGITLDNSEINQPFYKIMHYSDNYRGTGKTRLSQIYYFVINTDKQPDFSRINLTENEKQINMVACYITLDEFESILHSLMTGEDPIYRVISSEINDAYQEYKSTRS